jgi:antitoxin HicB
MKTMIYAYPAGLSGQEGGGVLVRFRDFPEALTEGADEAAALREAADCLSEAIASRILDNEEISAPSPARPDEYQVTPRIRIALKAALYSLLRECKMTVADLARLIDIDHKEARRLLDPKEPTKEARLEEALGALGYRSALALYIPERRRQRLVSVAGQPRKVPTVRNAVKVTRKKATA